MKRGFWRTQAPGWIGLRTDRRQDIGMKTIIAIGSNMGDRQGYMEEAIDLIGRRVGTVTAVSDVMETRAYGYTDQDDFLNMAICVDTDLSPKDLLEKLHEIEARLHRVRKIHWGPRTIDLDIIFYGDIIVDEEDLHIPHVDLYNRDFVLEPINEIAPGFVDPRTGKTVSRLLEELKERKVQEGDQISGSGAADQGEDINGLDS